MSRSQREAVLPVPVEVDEAVGYGPLSSSGAINPQGFTLGDGDVAFGSCIAQHWVACVRPECKTHGDSKREAGYFPRLRWNPHITSEQVLAFLRWRDEEGDFVPPGEGVTEWILSHEGTGGGREIAGVWETLLVRMVRTLTSDGQITVEVICQQRVVDGVTRRQVGVVAGANLMLCISSAAHKGDGREPHLLFGEQYFVEGLVVSPH